MSDSSAHSRILEAGRGFEAGHKYDFVPGAEIVFAEDLLTVADGAFPLTGSWLAEPG